MSKGSKFNVGNGKEFSEFLERIFLGGLVPECVIKINEEGLATCQAVDSSNAVCVSHEVQTDASTDVVLGIGNMATLTRYFASGGEFTVSYTEEKMVIKRKGHGQITCQLSVPEEVPTAIKYVDMKAMRKSKTRIELKPNKMADLLDFLALLGSESMVLASRKGVLYAQSSDSDVEQFKLNIGKCKDDIRVVTYAKHVQTIFRQTSKSEKVYLYLENDSAIMINQSNQYWLISPIEE